MVIIPYSIKNGSHGYVLQLRDRAPKILAQIEEFIYPCVELR
jgi:hypothetical protein